MGWFDKKEDKATPGSVGSEDTAAATAAAPAPANTNTATPSVAEEYDAVEAELLQAIARIKGRAAPQKAVPVAVSILYPISAAIAADERKKEAARKKAEEEALKNPTPGREIAGEGIFLGQYRPKDRAGNSLGKVFNVFAAKEDLTDASGKKETFKYVDAVKRVATLKGFHGHDGKSYATDKELYKALKDGSYDGGWVIPTRELLIGTEAGGPTGIRKGTVIQPDNLYDHRTKGALKDTFCTKAASGSGCPQWYWSCTERRDDPDRAWGADFSDGNGDWGHKDSSRLSCRLVRLVPVAG
jgi:hypothetical protein